MELTGGSHLFLVSFISILGSVLGQDSVCSTMQFRNLGAELQNEHQCMILEKIQMDLLDSRSSRNKQFNQLVSLISSIEMRLQRHSFSDRRGRGGNGLVKGFPSIKGTPVARDCYELYRNGFRVSGVYPIKFPQGNVLNVWCDLTPDQGGWTVIQRRHDGSENFTRDWDDYAFGFGNVNSEYYFGNENIHQMTQKGNYSLRIDLTDWEDNTVYAQYDHFSLDSEKESYRLHVTGYNGTAGDALNKYHNGAKFTTIDKDNDEWHSNCAVKDLAGWWYRACGFSSLNGIYIKGGKSGAVPDGFIRGIIWYHWKNDYGYSMKKSTMKIKPLVAIEMEAEQALHAHKKKIDMERRGGLTEEEEDAFVEIGIRRIIGKDLVFPPEKDPAQILQEKKEREEREKAAREDEQEKREKIAKGEDEEEEEEEEKAVPKKGK